jgi:phosphatidylglycerophosphate synthase
MRTAESPEKPGIADRCWANHITALGVVFTGVAGYLVHKGHPGWAGWALGAAGICDYGDGLEAKRFARRHPALAAERNNKGSLFDKTADRVRNIALALPIALNPEHKSRTRLLAGTIATREVAVGTAALASALRHHDGEGLPKVPPAPPRTREATVWIGFGLPFALGAHAAKQSGWETIGTFLEKSADTLLTAGLVRGLQGLSEYPAAIEGMHAAEEAGETDWQPDYKPHVGMATLAWWRQHHTTAPEIDQPLAVETITDAAPL